MKKRVLTRFGAAGVLVGLCLATTAAGPVAALPGAAGDGLGGHQATSSATPASVLLYEPVVHLYSTPEAEADLGFTYVKSSTGPTGRALASWVWPGMFAGDGLGLVSAGIGLPATNYPVRANSQFPEGGTTDADLAPGLVQRATTDADVFSAQVSMKPGAVFEESPQGATASSRRADNGLEGLPTLSGGTSSDGAAADEPAPTSALVDIDGMTSHSTVDQSDPSQVLSRVTSRVSGVTLLGGILTLDSVATRLATTSDGTSGTSNGSTTVAGLELNGTPISVTEKGVTVADESPEAPDTPAVRELLAELGIRLIVVPIEKQVKGAAATATASGLVVEIDSEILRSQLDTTLVETAIGPLPDDVRTEIETALLLSPRIIVRLGYAETSAAGALGMALPSLPATPTDAPAASGGDQPTGSPAGGTDAAAGPGSAPDLGPPAAVAAEASETTDAPISLASGPGLPPLASIPGFLLFGGLLLGGALGLYLQRLGGAALGGAKPCSHGNTSGIPDLRKV